MSNTAECFMLMLEHYRNGGRGEYFIYRLQMLAAAIIDGKYGL